MLDGLKIIDASSVLAGPSVATYFAELGAHVTKVEHPENPDVTRSWKLPSEDKNSPVSAYFSSVNYGKSYTKLDLNLDEDHSKFIEMISTADVLIMNFKRKVHDTTITTFRIWMNIITSMNSGIWSNAFSV